MKFKARQYGLLETTWATNFNPPGTPYQGVSDLDTGDAYPNQVQGLVHVKGSVAMKESAWIGGTVIAEGSAECDNYPIIVRDSTLYAAPPVGYRTTSMLIADGSWRQAVGP